MCIYIYILSILERNTNSNFNIAVKQCFMLFIQGLTGSNLTFSHHWWWESKSKLEFAYKSLEPENIALLKWLQLYQANSIISFPTDQLSDINYDTGKLSSFRIFLKYV